MLVWDFFVNLISYALDISQVEAGILLSLALIAGIIGCFYRWQPKGMSKKTKDKAGNEVTVYYELK